MKSNILLVGFKEPCVEGLVNIIEKAAQSEKIHVKLFDIASDSKKDGSQKIVSLYDEATLQDPTSKNIVDLFINASPQLSDEIFDYMNEDSWLISDANAFENILNYPERQDVYKKIKSHKRHILITASNIASHHGDERICGIVLLGAASKLIPISESNMVKSIYKVFQAKKEDIIKSNITAFREGKSAAEEFLTFAYTD